MRLKRHMVPINGGHVYTVNLKESEVNSSNIESFVERYEDLYHAVDVNPEKYPEGKYLNRSLVHLIMYTQNGGY